MINDKFCYARLPSINEVRRKAQALAMLDAMLSPEWEYRYFSYNAAWGEHEEMASMRDGCGNEWFMLFSPVGVAIKGFAHESALAHNSLFSTELKRSVPSDFSDFLNEPAFSMDRTTFCYWRRSTDDVWSKAYHPSPELLSCDDGSDELLALLLGQPDDYQRWALDYYQLNELHIDSVHAVFERVPLTQHLAYGLKAESSFSDLLDEAKAIGYPIA
jgi:hypothetical protein